ncbi:carbamate kinase [Actinomyces sp. oral taxon 170]|uniref:carbamate kinase n=1 Tax=Actinomyces sp. oral taxon 170 TaxID=712117 RepID=UPI000205C765|nr:carbamate kinase [Actinomyces sp. oral taxon 170]EGF56270.1 carbamate kinase [Actinomyces sp. oral taxon 170 str. F0386]
MQTNNRGIVIAVGGNALIKKKNQISTDNQSEAIRETCTYIADIVEQGYNPVITHGNGPQVGFLLRRAELALGELPAIPLDVLGADTQGATGYLFARNLRNVLTERSIERHIAAIVTQSVVDPDDPAFDSPTKPIGSFMDEQEAEKHRVEDGWVVKEDAGRGFRRVVASPQPIDIIELGIIKSLISSGVMVIAAGGGGIPVTRENGTIRGREAVIDKDLASSLLANSLEVEDFIICTAVDQVYLDFNSPTQRGISTMTADEAAGYLTAEQFGSGSMAPKIEAAIKFLENGGQRVIITSLDRLADALDGKAGTTITN